MAQETRFNRRVVGMLKARLPDLRLDQVVDPRSKRGRRWSLTTMLQTVVVGLVAGCKSLADVEVLTAQLSLTTRRQLGIRRRVPDTTLRTLLCRLQPDCLRRAIHSLVRKAHRRKALAPQGFPFGIVAMDGKATALYGSDSHQYAPRHTFDGQGRPIGMMRTITCALVSAASKVVIDAVPTNTPAEAQVFKEAFAGLIEAYGKSNLFRVVTYDAGAASASNAALIATQGYDYVFAFKKGQKALTKESQRLLAELPIEQALVTTENVLGGGKRNIRRLFLTEARTELSDEQWLALIRLHWNVENNCHGCLDVSFEEDDHPWIEANAQGAVVMALLRRIAFDLLALFRSVTQRSDEKRATPWRRLMQSVQLALFTLTEPQAAGLRPRHPAPV